MPQAQAVTARSLPNDREPPIGVRCVDVSHAVYRSGEPLFAYLDYFRISWITRRMGIAEGLPGGEGGEPL